jgi:glycosyltransferase involved in cell wall biosynthesis
MDKYPLISIITCFLNEERFIEDAIKSVLHQEYKNWELFLIDDGSTDKSTDIVKMYANKYPGKITYLDHEEHANKGVSASRNYALKIASGEYIAVLDADDFWLPQFLSNVIVIMVHQNASMVCEASEYWKSWKQDGEKNNKVIPVGVEENKLYAPLELMFELYPLGKGSAPCPCAILMKKDVLINHGGFNESFGLYEDQVFLTKFYINEYVYISSNCHNLYRVREGSVVHTYRTNGKYFQERKNYLDWLEQYLIENNINSPKVHDRLNQAFLPYRRPHYYYFFHHVPNRLRNLHKKLSRNLSMII